MTFGIIRLPPGGRSAQAGKAPAGITAGLAPTVEVFGEIRFEAEVYVAAGGVDVGVDAGVADHHHVELRVTHAE